LSLYLESADSIDASSACEMVASAAAGARTGDVNESNATGVFQS